MAFRKNKRTSIRRFRTPLAKVRRDWHTALNVTCGDLVIAMRDECTTLAEIVLVDQTTLQSKYSDRATVKRLLGDLWFRPQITPAALAFGDLVGLTTLVGNYTQLFVGLRKREVNASGQSFAVDPYFHDEDMSDSQWIRTWQHLFYGDACFEESLVDVGSVSFPVVCTDTHTTGLPSNTFVNGTGDIDIETDCLPPDCVACPNETGTEVTSLKACLPRPFHLHMDLKKSISLRDNEELTLTLSIANEFFAQLQPHGHVMRVRGNVRAVMQM